MKLSTSSARSCSRQLQTVSRVASTRSAVQALSGVQIARRGRRVELRATDMEVGLRVPLEAEVDARGRRRAARPPAARRRPRAARRRGLARAARRRAGRRGRRRHRALPHPHAARRGLPAAARSPSGDAGRRACPAPAFVETVARVARSASRDETRPVLTGILVSASGERAADGRHRLLPPERQGDDARGAAATGGFEANVPARALQELARIVRRPTSRTLAHRRARQPGRLRGRRRRAVVAADRRSVPELPPAAARGLRARAAARRRRSSREVVRRISLLAQKNAPLRLALQRGRADGLGADAGRRRGAARRCRCRSQGEPFEIGFNPEFLRDGLESVEAERRRAEADQPAAPGPDRVRPTAAASST